MITVQLHPREIPILASALKRHANRLEWDAVEQSASRTDQENANEEAAFWRERALEVRSWERNPPRLTRQRKAVRT